MSLAVDLFDALSDDVLHCYGWVVGLESLRVLQGEVEKGGVEGALVSNLTT